MFVKEKYVEISLMLNKVKLSEYKKTLAIWLIIVDTFFCSLICF